MSAAITRIDAAVESLWLRDRLERLRRRLRRKVLWLRATWAADPLQDYHGLVISDIQADRLLQPFDAGAEANFYAEDPTAAALTAQMHLGDSSAETEDSPLSRLARTFGLSRFEEETLLLCVAPWLDATFNRLYAYIQDDVTRRLATPALALAVLLEPHADPAQAIASFGTSAPLLRHRLVVSADNAAVGLDRALSVDQRIADYVCSIDHLDARLLDVSRPVERGLEVPNHDLMVASVLAWLQHSSQYVVNLHGRQDSGQRELAQNVSEALGLHLIELDLARLGSLPDQDDVFAAIERDARLSRLAVFAVAYDGVPAFVERLDIPLFIATRDRWTTSRCALAVAMPALEADDCAQMWRAALGETEQLETAITACAEQFVLGPQSVAAASAGARALAAERGFDGVPSHSDLWQACRQEAQRDMDQLAQRIKPCHGWDDLIVPKRVLEQLRDIAGQVANRAVVYRQWKLAARLNRGRGTSALFAGPSGTGKTLAAEVLAAELDVDLYRVDLATVIDKYIGETEKRLRQLFDTAEESGAMLFIDEADALTGRRTEIRDSHDRYANLSVSYLLQRMEDFSGLVILATNRRSDIDRAFLRRLRFLVEFPFPSIEERQRIWSRAMPPDAPTADLDFAALGRLELTGGSIHTIAINASFLAAAEATPIDMRHLMRAAARECMKLDKLITPAEFGIHYEVVVA